MTRTRRATAPGWPASGPRSERRCSGERCTSCRRARATALTTTSTGNEEWLIALEGKLTLRGPDGEEELAPGDVVCFPVGPEGAHQLLNRTQERVRVLMLSTMVDPSAAVYPDSDKIGFWPGTKEDHILVRRESGVDYWDGEVLEDPSNGVKRRKNPPI